MRTLRVYFVVANKRFRIGWERHESLFVWRTHFIEVSWQ
jgi:hypothetical protein